MSKTYRITRILCFLGLAITVASFAAGKHKSVFEAYFLCLPILWLLWIVNVFKAELDHSLRSLLMLWLVIDISILVLLVSLSVSLENWFKTDGLDILLLTAYFPLDVPGLLLLRFLYNSFHITVIDISKVQLIEKMLGGDIGEVIVTWLILSILTAIPAILLIVVTRFLKRTARNKLAHGEL